MSWSKKLLCCILPSLSLIEAQARYRFDQWTTDNGLPQNTVRRIAQTSDGYLWFTTLDGLVRFDGVRFTRATRISRSALRQFSRIRFAPVRV